MERYNIVDIDKQGLTWSGSDKKTTTIPQYEFIFDKLHIPLDFADPEENPSRFKISFAYNFIGGGTPTKKYRTVDCNHCYNGTNWYSFSYKVDNKDTLRVAVNKSTGACTVDVRENLLLTDLTSQEFPYDDLFIMLEYEGYDHFNVSESHVGQGDVIFTQQAMPIGEYRCQLVPLNYQWQVVEAKCKYKLNDVFMEIDMEVYEPSLHVYRFDTPEEVDNNELLLFALFEKTIYSLTVVNGDPSYSEVDRNTNVEITADEAPEGKEFNKWTCNVSEDVIANVYNPTTIVHVDRDIIIVSATYKDIPTPPTPTVEEIRMAYVRFDDTMTVEVEYNVEQGTIKVSKYE